jgi:hypothetical protein
MLHFVLCAFPITGTLRSPSHYSSAHISLFIGYLLLDWTGLQLSRAWCSASFCSSSESQIGELHIQEKERARVVSEQWPSTSHLMLIEKKPLLISLNRYELGGVIDLRIGSSILDR